MTRRRSLPLLAAALLAASPVRASLGPGSEEAAPEPRSEASRWWWLAPGGGHYLLGQDGLGTAYLLSTAGFVGWGLAVEGSRGSGEWNAPLVYAQQVYILSITSAYRDLRLRSRPLAGPPPDPASNVELAEAPFKPSVFTRPWVWGAFLAGAGINLLSVGTHDAGFGHVARMRYLGATFDGRGAALAGYTGYWAPLSLGAGVSEESLFRGVFQNDFERRWGPGVGLVTASALFGIAHLSDPSSGSSWGQVGFASLAGLYLGWRYQRNGYTLSESVAAHFWFDLAAGLAVFLANPKENPLGAQIQYGF